jgi:uncharacterized membrane protein YgdD (TMEM256/DUF423 family)
MNYRTALILGCAFAALAVISGAMGAHQLKNLLEDAGRTDTYELAVKYHFYHAFALIATGIIQKLHEQRSLKWPAVCFTGGIFLFSGSLYLICFTGITKLGVVTPIGGLLFIAGWLILLVKLVKK